MARGKRKVEAAQSETLGVVGVFGGVDTHRDTHTAAALDAVGRELGHRTFPATPAGYLRLAVWLAGFGRLVRVGVEGTGSYGAGLARHLAGLGVEVVEVDRPDRAARRRAGKSDPLDARAAARAALAGTASGVPKARTGAVEAVRVLRVARSGAVRQRADVQRQMKSLVVSAPEPLRGQLRALTASALVKTCAAFRPDPARTAEPATATRYALRSLARRHAALTVEVADLDTQLAGLVEQLAPTLLACHGFGVETVGTLLVALGDNPARIRSEAALATVAGAAPVPASTGNTDRHRLNRGGDRQANRALHQVVVVRMAHHQPTRDYVARRLRTGTSKGLTKKEVMRCLKRYLVREVYQHLVAPHAPANNPREAT
jgi:transposase